MKVMQKDKLGEMDVAHYASKKAAILMKKHLLHPDLFTYVEAIPKQHLIVFCHRDCIGNRAVRRSVITATLRIRYSKLHVAISRGRRLFAFQECC